MNYSMKNEKENFYFVNVKLQQCTNVEYSAEHEIKITLIMEQIKCIMTHFNNITNEKFVVYLP